MLDVWRHMRGGRGEERRGSIGMIIDDDTIAAYDRDAAHHADDWESQPAPTDLHDVARRFFAPGPTADIEGARFANVLCETVIMHLPADAIAAAVDRLLAILAPGGTLYLSWRVTPRADIRDSAGRLYTAFDANLVLPELSACEILHDQETNSLSSGKLIRRLVARKPLKSADSDAIAPRIPI